MSLISVPGRPETVASLPTNAEVWAALRVLYGPKLVGATLVAIVDTDGNVTMQTMTFPLGDA